MKGQDAFTLIEVLVSIFIFSLLCFSFLATSQFIYKSHTISKGQFEVLTKAENSLEKIKSAMDESSREELNAEVISSIVEDAKDPENHYTIKLEETDKRGLYEVEIIFEESRYEKLWTQIYVP